MDKNIWQSEKKGWHLPQKYKRSIKDFLIINGMVCSVFFVFFMLLLFAFSKDQFDMTGIGSCGTRDCIDQ